MTSLSTRKWGEMKLMHMNSLEYNSLLENGVLLYIIGGGRREGKKNINEGRRIHLIKQKRWSLLWKKH